VTAFAGSWKRDATGGITIDQPMGGPNERAGTHSLNETLSILASAGVPRQGVRVRPYQARPDKLANLRLGFPLIVATAGPCGLWPDDLGPTYQRSHFENQPYWNLGCATQRNLASMVENPADLVQPRAETPAYAAKRNVALDKWRRGESPHTHYPDPNKGAVSELGK
jgi:pilus assembly protein CpaD